MYLYCTTKFLFFLLFGFKEIYSTRAICLENDITKLLDHWIDEIFTIGLDQTKELIATVKDYKLKEFEYKIEPAEKSNQTQSLFFQNVNFHVKEESESDIWEPPQLYWKLSEYRMVIFFEEIHMRVWGTVGKTKGEEITEFNTFLGIENFTFTANGTSNKSPDSSISYEYDISSSGFWYWLTDQINIIWTNPNLTDHDKEDLAKQIKPALPDMLHQNILNNLKFSYLLTEIFQTNDQPRQKIISKHPDFLNNPQQYYYLIPKFPLRCFNLKRIVIKGLSNLDSFKLHETSPIFTHTLLIKNLQGSMILDYGFENETSLELNFRINSLFVSKKEETECINVHAKYYSITRAELDTALSTRQSEVIINGLESAIGSSLFSSTEVRRICDLDTSLEDIKITNTSDWKTIKESYRGWIPFNDDEAKVQSQMHGGKSNWKP